MIEKKTFLSDPRCLIALPFDFVAGSYNILALLLPKWGSIQGTFTQVDALQAWPTFQGVFSS